MHNNKKSSPSSCVCLRCNESQVRGKYRSFSLGNKKKTKQPCFSFFLWGINTESFRLLSLQCKTDQKPKSHNKSQWKGNGKWCARVCVCVRARACVHHHRRHHQHHHRHGYMQCAFFFSFCADSGDHKTQQKQKKKIGPLQSTTHLFLHIAQQFLTSLLFCRDR